MEQNFAKDIKFWQYLEIKKMPENRFSGKFLKFIKKKYQIWIFESSLPWAGAQA
ncbi:MAG: hypothetical protein ACLFPE_00740 [Bacteroidales bacterium]